MRSPGLLSALGPRTRESHARGATPGGAALMKVFPDCAVGPGCVREFRAPPGMKAVLTGGMTIEGLGRYRAAVATAVTPGGGPVQAEFVAPGGRAAITERAGHALPVQDGGCSQS